MIELLYERGIEVDAAIWVFDSEHGGWKLRLHVDRRPDSSFLPEVMHLKASGEDVPFFNEVHFVAADDPIVTGTRQERTSGLLVEDQLGKGLYGGEFVEDIYIYRVAA